MLRAQVASAPITVSLKVLSFKNHLFPVGTKVNKKFLGNENSDEFTSVSDPRHQT